MDILRRPGIAIIILMVMPMANPCMLVPEGTVGGFKELVERTEQILYAKMIDIEISEKSVIYSFNVIESIKGPPMETATVELPKVYIDYPKISVTRDAEDFMGHQDPAFWDGHIARHAILPNCQVVPHFYQERKYLLFLSSPYHVAGFEEIVDSSDSWLNWVRRATASSIASNNQDLLDYIGSHRSIYLGRCKYDEQGIQIELETRLAGDIVKRPVSKLDFGRYSRVQAGCFKDNGKMLLLFYNDENLPTKAVPIMEGEVYIGWIDTNLIFSGSIAVPLEAIIHHFNEE